MTSKEITLYAMREQGKNQAAIFRAEVIEKDLDGTAVIAKEFIIPEWREGKYEKVGAPVKHLGQVYKVWQAHDSTGNPDWSPDKAVSLFDIYHTKDPGKAKPYMPPQGSRGLYDTGECMVWTDGKVYVSTIENNAYTPETYPNGWAEHQ